MALHVVGAAQEFFDRRKRKPSSLEQKVLKSVKPQAR